MFALCGAIVTPCFCICAQTPAIENLTMTLLSTPGSARRHCWRPRVHHRQHNGRVRAGNGASGRAAVVQGLHPRTLLRPPNLSARLRLSLISYHEHSPLSPLFPLSSFVCRGALFPAARSLGGSVSRACSRLGHGAARHCGTAQGSRPCRRTHALPMQDCARDRIQAP